MAKLKIALSLVLPVLRVVQFYSCNYGKRCLYLPFCQYLRLFKRGFKPEEVPERRLDELELWNCFSYYPAVTSYDILDGQSGKYFGKDKKTHAGAYLFTVDWGHPESNIVDTDHSEIPHEHKCAHILALDDGNYAAQPTID